jgi:hypothetical protein
MCWLPQLALLIENYPDVRVVIHSSWREHQSVEHLRGQMGKVGSRLLGVTPQGARYDSIVAYLAAHPDVQGFRILDDMASEFPQPAPPELVLCDPVRGLSAKATRKQIRSWLEDAA